MSCLYKGEFKVRTQVFHGNVEGKVSIVEMKESPARGVWESLEQRENGVNQRQPADRTGF